LDYGAMPDVPILHGIGPIEQGAEELAEFVDKVLQSTGADKVDIVGHSQGGMMPRYYLKFLGGASRVNQLIALAPSNHGTTMNGLFLLATQFPDAARLMRDNFPPACGQQEADCAFMTKLNEGGDTVPGVRYTVIATKYDEVVTPTSRASSTGSTCATFSCRICTRPASASTCPSRSIRWLCARC
jgi:triacylglycerol esterase/lipase EstA (alpha/beta hydrolase family)